KALGASSSARFVGAPKSSDPGAKQCHGPSQFTRPTQRLDEALLGYATKKSAAFASLIDQPHMDTNRLCHGDEFLQPIAMNAKRFDASKLEQQRLRIAAKKLAPERLESLTELRMRVTTAESEKLDPISERKKADGPEGALLELAARNFLTPQAESLEI